jgi:hypothetical protein
MAENLMNSAHKSNSQAFRDGWERTFRGGWDETDEVPVVIKNRLPGTPHEQIRGYIAGRWCVTCEHFDLPLFSGTCRLCGPGHENWRLAR